MPLLWQGFPFIAVTVLAGLKTVPAELHESALVDGAGPWRIFWRVTCPLLKPIFLVLLLLSVIWNFLRNSLFVTAVAASSLIAMLAAIALARFRFRFRTSYLIMLLIVQMLPQQALVIALFLDFRRLNLLDSLVGLILVYTAFALPVTIWMLRNFVATVPREMEEAAAIDGAGPLRVFWRILLPLTAPGLVATSVFAFIFAWNEFVFALTFLGTDTAKYTLPIYVQYFYGRGSVDWGGIMAASTLFTIPVMVFFLIVQRRMVNGLVAGAVKG